MRVYILWELDLRSKEVMTTEVYETIEDAKEGMENHISYVVGTGEDYIITRNNDKTTAFLKHIVDDDERGYFLDRAYHIKSAPFMKSLKGEP